jgi:hypothetical protein
MGMLSMGVPGFATRLAGFGGGRFFAKGSGLTFAGRSRVVPLVLETLMVGLEPLALVLELLIVGLESLVVRLELLIVGLELLEFTLEDRDQFGVVEEDGEPLIVGVGRHQPLTNRAKSVHNVGQANSTVKRALNKYAKNARLQAICVNLYARSATGSGNPALAIAV